MLVLTCPFCGPREFTEFEYGGAAGLERPTPDADAKAWLGYLYLRENPTGWRRELWAHRHGCGSWFEVERHSATHEIRQAGGRT